MSDMQKLRDELVVMSKYGSALGVLNWDQEVNLPKKGHASWVWLKDFMNLPALIN
jgi:Zn-dependent M32 family carboxypeptidase